MNRDDAPLTRQVRTLNAAGAKIALAAAEAAARERGVTLCVSVVDQAGYLLAFTRMDGALPTSIEASIRKARTAAQSGVPTKRFQDLLDAGNTSLLAFEFICPSQGGVPVILDGVAVGGVAASGGSLEDDEFVAQAGADGLGAALNGR